MLCGEIEDANHIFFKCHLATFMWACIRDLLGCSWNPAGAGSFLAISQGLSGRTRRLAWVCFAALCWSLWLIRNKMVFEHTFVAHPADCIFQMIITLQGWRLLSRRKDRAALDAWWVPSGECSRERLVSCSVLFPSVFCLLCEVPFCQAVAGTLH